MDLLEKKEYYNSLFDIYENLLTEKQKVYFKEYYFEDWSLSEIALAHDVSRNAVFDSMQKVYRLLENYEEKLRIFQKNQQRMKLLERYDNDKEANIKQLIEELKEIE